MQWNETIYRRAQLAFTNSGSPELTLNPPTLAFSLQCRLSEFQCHLPRKKMDKITFDTTLITLTTLHSLGLHLGVPTFRADAI
jgi:hypothetical protein